MFKKSLFAVGIAGALVFAGSAAASALTYPDSLNVTAEDTTIAPGESTTITATELDGETATFDVVSGPAGSTLSSLVFTAASAGVQKPIANRSASVEFTPAAVGTHVITVTDANGTDRITITVGTASADGTLPATGGTLPAQALWIGIGALGLGAIAVTAGIARRRASAQR